MGCQFLDGFGNSLAMGYPRFRVSTVASESLRQFAWDGQHPAQIPYVYEMRQVMGRRFDISLVVPSALCVDPTTLDIVLDFYADWQNNRDINFNVLDCTSSDLFGQVGPINKVYFGL